MFSGLAFKYDKVVKTFRAGGRVMLLSSQVGAGVDFDKLNPAD